jgi:hypothetical protein
MVRVRSTMQLTVSQSVSQPVLVFSFVWGSWPEISSCMKFTALLIWEGTFSDERRGRFSESVGN